jgi:2,3-bisphosphoglycerate-independent phosphoglycerate mutase
MKKVMLIILDGWGEGPDHPGNAVIAAATPNYDKLVESNPSILLEASGLSVGLPEGQMGNSEVGHLTIGAGRVVYQELSRINNAFGTNELSSNVEIINLANYCTSNNKSLHLIGLLSDGGVHSHINHLLKTIELLTLNGVPRIYIHAFLDGRDTDPTSGVTFLTTLTEFIESYDNVHLVSIIGRYYAMDRDNRWERTAKAYNLLIGKEGEIVDSLINEVTHQYSLGITDEFMIPLRTRDFVPIMEDDAVLFFNFRTDRGRQLTRGLTQQDLVAPQMKPFNSLYFVTLTLYDKEFKDIHVVFPPQSLKNTLGEVLEKHDLKQLRAAETEKYPHVTFFFNGQVEQPYPNEKRYLEPSPKVATYDLQPEMSLLALNEGVIKAINVVDYSFVCVNFANPDMVGHTGVFSAIVKACEAVDIELGRLVLEAKQHNYQILVTADHGNAEYAMNEDGSPNTAHTTNPVRLIMVNSKLQFSRNSGSLADLAPTVLTMLGLPIPSEMSGSGLV